MKIILAVVGRLKEDYWKGAEAEYLKRLKHYADIRVLEHKEDAALQSAIPAQARLVLLDERGENWSSPELAKFILGEEQRGGSNPLVFAIGGPDGFSPGMRARAAKLFALGRITLPHRLARIVLVEQLYRAYSILRGEPYHRS